MNITDRLPGHSVQFAVHFTPRTIGAKGIALVYGVFDSYDDAKSWAAKAFPNETCYVVQLHRVSDAKSQPSTSANEAQ